MQPTSRLSAVSKSARTLAAAAAAALPAIIAHEAKAALYPIISLTTTVPPTTNYGQQITNGTGANQGTFSTGTNVLTVTGGSGKYHYAQVTNINAATPMFSVEANGFNPASDIEIYALDLVSLPSGGTQLSATNLQTLAADINSTNAYGYGSSIASTSLASDPFPAQYNLFLTFTGLTSGQNFLGFAVDQDPNANVATFSYATAIAVVPEPMTLGLLTLGSVGLLTRRRAFVRT
jgi:hypothetical protein